MTSPPRIASVNTKDGSEFQLTTPTSGGLGPLAFNSAYPATATPASG